MSIDIIFDIQWGNLLQKSTFELFARAINDRVMLGFLAGPPCETWSRAREVGGTQTIEKPSAKWPSASKL